MLNGKCEYDSKNMSNSISDSNFHSSEEITKRSTISEHKISEIEEIKTIKKIILNGCEDQTDSRNESSFKTELPSTNKTGVNGSEFPHTHYTKNISLLSHQSPRSEREVATPIHDRNEYYSTFNQDERNCSSTSRSRDTGYQARPSSKCDILYQTIFHKIFTFRTRYMRTVYLPSVYKSSIPMR